MSRDLCAPRRQSAAAEAIQALQPAQPCEHRLDQNFAPLVLAPCARLAQDLLYRLLDLFPGVTPQRPSPPRLGALRAQLAIATLRSPIADVARAAPIAHTIVEVQLASGRAAVALVLRLVHELALVEVSPTCAPLPVRIAGFPARTQHVDLALSQAGEQLDSHVSRIQQQRARCGAQRALM